MFDRTILAALIGSLCVATGHAQENTLLHLSGFGTMAATHFDRNDIDFGGGPNVMNGVGRTTSTSFGVDSKAGVQLRITPMANLEATVQSVVKKTPRNDWTPTIDWANIKYSVNENIAVRAGRIGHPFFMISDYRQVNYANVALRPAVEVYNLVPINSSDVIEGLFKFGLAGGQVNVQAGVGRADTDVIRSSYERDYDEVKVRKMAYVNATYEIGAWTLRAGRTEGDLSYDALGARRQVFDTLSNLGSTGNRIRNQWEIKDAKSSFTGIGATYDQGNIILTGEYVMLRSEKAYNDTDAWSILGGYRIGKFTPYVSYAAAKTKNRIQVSDVASQLTPLVGASNAAQLQGGIQALADASVRDQNTSSIGVRWDVYKNMALKAQYDHIRIEDPSTQGFLINKSSTYPTRAGGNAFAVSLDFVF